MQATLTANKPFSLPGANQHGSALASPLQALSSLDLLQGQKVVEILHNGAIYRLQATKLGKLILTK